MKLFSVYILPLFILWFAALHNLTAQSSSVAGLVIDCTSQHPLPDVMVRLIETDRWTTTNKRGAFVFNNLPPGNHTLQTHCLGYVPYQQTIHRFNPDSLIICLKISTYSIDEITVLETKGNLLTSSTVIGSQAIEHVQPASLKDILQLVPGATVQNPDLSDPQYIGLRDIRDNVSSAVGAAILIDGMPISNGANMQTYSTAQINTLSTGIAEYSTFKYPTVIGNGVDLRSISTDRIESVEVISGIPSVTYGDLTSGAVVVKSKNGRSPWQAKLKTDPKLKMVSINKGFILTSGGSLNTGLDYTRSHKDLRSRYESYDRVTGQIAFSEVLFKNTLPLSFNASLNLYSTVDHQKTDPEAMVANEVYESVDRGLQAGVQGKWAFNKPWLTNLHYSISAAVAQQKSYQKSYRSGELQKLSFAVEEGENEGIYLPGESLTELTIKGLPFSLYGQVYASKSSLIGNAGTHNFIAGIEYRSSGNNGDGRIYDIKNPPTIINNISRPRSFKNIPKQNTLSAFLEENISFAIGQTRLSLQAGARFNNFQALGVVESGIGWYTEPRANAKYMLINKSNTFIKHLSFNAGIGKHYKSPALMYLYPDKAYFDLVSLDHYTGNPQTNMTIFDTRLLPTSNPGIKPSENTKKEIGLEVKMGIISANFSVYNESLTSGLGMGNKYQFIEYKLYDAQGVNTDEKPVLADLPFQIKEYILSYSQPINNKKTKKQGFEYTLNFEKIKGLNTRISVNGAWKKNRQVFSTAPMAELPAQFGSGQSKYVAVYPGGESRVNESMNTRLRLVTHSTRLRLIVTTSINFLWYNKYYYPRYNQTPVYLFGKEEDKIPFTEDMEQDPLYYNYVNVKSPAYYKTERMPFLPVCNVRISKELGRGTLLSFYANNFINYRPMYQYSRTDKYLRRNPAIYFGAELKVSIP
ncbi:Outer membrane receptor for ferrienterochelin and colicins [Saccharicrinis carchari]|uniref:Outer membrane receptor for ferrienterochelin and colicins n=1 Tax=Saccharicrinis carchari TaxID=1168039 RepID=A0A521EPA2_SACCC|nr:carboxypeptidase-like regulatory domain-containing protein [Saccharicrinis carchari]SMO85757.1 Outer membrane receptor for ferrienterochelin and colicins [Saccharicrinis carchari]